MNINIVTEVVWQEIRNQVFDATKHRTRYFVNNIVKLHVLDHGLSEIELEEENMQNLISEKINSQIKKQTSYNVQVRGTGSERSFLE